MKEKKIKFAFFTIPEYEKEQDWLREQHVMGWALDKVIFPGVYHFKRCTPEDVIYQLDYNQEGRKNKGEYVQMFIDCQWEYITDFVGYSYFRKKVTDMGKGEEEIFSDHESKLDMTRRVFRGRMVPLVVIMFTLILPQLFMQFASTTRPIYILYDMLFILYIVIFVRFGQQYWSLKQKSSK